jgi:hypothetical protein
MKLISFRVFQADRQWLIDEVGGLDRHARFARKLLKLVSRPLQQPSLSSQLKKSI